MLTNRFIISEAIEIKGKYVETADARGFLKHFFQRSKKIIEDEIQAHSSNVLLYDRVKIKEITSLAISTCEDIFKSYNFGGMLREYNGVGTDIDEYTSELKKHCDRYIKNANWKLIGAITGFIMCIVNHEEIITKIQHFIVHLFLKLIPYFL